MGEDGILGEIDQGFSEADLSEHLVARDRAFARCVEEDVRLFLCVFVIITYGVARFERRVVDRQVEEGGRQSAHLPCWCEARVADIELIQLKGSLRNRVLMYWLVYYLYHLYRCIVLGYSYGKLGLRRRH